MNLLSLLSFKYDHWSHHESVSLWLHEIVHLSTMHQQSSSAGILERRGLKGRHGSINENKIRKKQSSGRKRRCLPKMEVCIYSQPPCHVPSNDGFNSLSA